MTLNKTYAGASLDLDYAGLFPSRDVGLFAGGLDTSGLPSQLAAFANQYGYSKLTVKNGDFVQGNGHSARGAGLWLDHFNGLTVDNVEISVNGMDTNNLLMAFGGSSTTSTVIQNSTFTADVELLSNRRRNFAGIKLEANQGNLTVQNNTITGVPMIGIFVSRHSNNSGTVLINRNTIDQDAKVVDAYGILLCGLNNFEVAKNTIITQAGRGIIVDGFGGHSTQNGEIHHNTVDIQDVGNLEYGLNHEGTALRLRNNGSEPGSFGEHRNLYIHDNEFKAKTTDAGTRGAVGVRLSTLTHRPNNPQNLNGGIVFENNRFEARVETTDVTKYAYGASVAYSGSGTGTVFRNNNKFASNHIPLRFGDEDTPTYTVPVANPQIQDVQFENNTQIKLLDAPTRSDYQATVVGTNKIANTMVQNIRVKSPIYMIGNTISTLPIPVFEGTGATAIGFGEWWLTATVTHQGAAKANTVVTATISDGQIVSMGTTDANGQARLLIPQTLYYQVANSTTTITSNPTAFTITGTYSAIVDSKLTVLQSGSTSIGALTADQSITFLIS
jgi:hypothetical protein